MVIEIKHKNKILNIKLDNKIEKEIVTISEKSHRGTTYGIVLLQFSILHPSPSTSPFEFFPKEPLNR